MVSMLAVGPLLTPAFVPLATEFNVPLQQFTLGKAYPYTLPDHELID